MTDQELRDAITTAGNQQSGHVTVGSCEELLQLFRTVLADRANAARLDEIVLDRAAKLLALTIRCGWCDAGNESFYGYHYFHGMVAQKCLKEA